jgi:hypothetical protein
MVLIGLYLQDLLRGFGLIVGVDVVHTAPMLLDIHVEQPLTLVSWQWLHLRSVLKAMCVSVVMPSDSIE